MEVLSKDMIERWVIPHLSKGERGPKPQVELVNIVRAILHRLKTGTQWRFLPLGEFFKKDAITCNGVYHHHRKWIKDGSWRKVWIELLKANRHLLDLSSMQLDGSQTPCKKQGEHIGYQGRKASKTTNVLFLSDKEGQPLAMATPQAGNHNDLYDIQQLFKQMCALLEEAGIDLRGVFMNADAGFDAEDLREVCAEKEIEVNIAENKRNEKELKEDYVYFDELLYKQRYVIERTNAWLDGFKSLLVRYEVKVSTWMAAHFMAFVIIFLKTKLNC
ncbi:MAG: IS5 family transposase [Chitinophagaceae bacterium]|nr:IS5 family transposase [Chitinophagaceae bacterium]